MRCLAREIELESIEQRDRARREAERAAAAIQRANELIDSMAWRQTSCSACGEPFVPSRSVLFQGDRLVHADCWRADGELASDAPPPS
jgi:hypothetical protein